MLIVPVFGLDKQREKTISCLLFNQILHLCIVNILFTFKHHFLSTIRHNMFLFLSTQEKKHVVADCTQEVVLEGEEDVDDTQVEDLIKQKTRNSLFTLFIKAKNWDNKHQTVRNDNTPLKRKCNSPERGTPSKTRPRQSDNSPCLRPRVNSVAVPTGAKKWSRKRRNKSESLPKDQQLLTSMWSKEKKI